VSTQAKPISEVVKDFEQSLENLRPSTKRVYVAGARAAISLEFWQSPSATDLGINRKSPHRKEGTNLAFPGFFRPRGTQTIGFPRGLGGSAKLGDSRTRKADALREKPSITRDTALIAVSGCIDSIKAATPVAEAS
jgi:hypothetical protein